MEPYVCLFDFCDVKINTLYYLYISHDNKSACAYINNDVLDMESCVGIYKMEYFISLAKFREIRIDEIINGDYEG